MNKGNNQPEENGAPSRSDNALEIWKALIDFNKTVISLSSAVLTGLIGYYLISSEPIFSRYISFISPTFLLLSIVFAVFGFGGAISKIGGGRKGKNAELHSNLAVAALVVGIVMLGAIKNENKQSFSKILNKIEGETKSMYEPMTPHNFLSMNLKNGVFTIKYETSKGIRIVIYSEDEKSINEIR